MLDRLPSARDARRQAFADFLRSRRERLSPALAGLPNGARRRTPGLRREEVALLAGVGATWYTWLEQGRDVRPSAETLASLAEALQLDNAERNYLFTLAEHAPRAVAQPGPETAPDSLVRMLRSMTGQPAYVLGRRWDILAWNDAATELFGDFGRLDGDARNLMGLMFLDPAHRARLVDWDDLAPSSLATFRADSAAYAGDPEFERLIALLTAGSEPFRRWWPRRDILREASTVKRVRDATGAIRSFEYLALEVIDRPGMRLVVCTPRETGSPEA